MAAQEKKEAQVLVRMDNSLYRRLYRAAKKDERTIPGHIRFLLEKCLPKGSG